MRKRISALLVNAVVLSMSAGSFAAVNSAKFQGSHISGCSFYQLGTYEFVLKLNGRKLPVPDVDIDDSSLSIIFDNSIADDKDDLQSSADDFIEGVPILHSFELENVSHDKECKVLINLEAGAPMSVISKLRTATGYTIRVKVDEHSLHPEEFVPLIPKPTVIFPETVLPFKAETRTSVDFREAELQDVFRLFMAALGRNIVIDSSFPRDVFVTMTLDNVRIDEIMNYLLRTYDIACYNYAPNITAFGTREGLYKLSGAKELKTFKITYASPQRIGELLKNLLGFSVTLIRDSAGSGTEQNTTSSTSTGSSVTANVAASTTQTVPTANTISEIMIDERLRTLYVKTNPARMQEVEEMIAMLDVPLRQVMIRASIFEFSEEATKDVEKSINLVYDRWSLNADNGNGVLQYIDQTYSQGRSGFDRYVTAMFSALESRNKGRTVANPSVITLEGEEAKITLKQDIMYSAGRDDSGNPTWSTTEVGPELTFTPVIEDKGYINLKIEINTGDYLGKDSDGNIITTDRNVETQIRVRDGMPFVVGGLFQDIRNNNHNKIPILGDIPLLGELFTYRSNERTKTQAVMIVTPYILDTK